MYLNILLNTINKQKSFLMEKIVKKSYLVATVKYIFNQMIMLYLRIFLIIF